MSSERDHHIHDMLQDRRLSACTAVNRDRSVFDLPLQLADGKLTTLRISLPPRFPEERPVLIVTTRVDNPRVDSTGRVHTKEVEEWQYPYSNLTETVKDAVDALGRVAPPDAKRPQPGGPLPMSPSGKAAPSGIASPPPPPQATSSIASPRPRASLPVPQSDEVAALVKSELQGKKGEELEVLLADDSVEGKALMAAVIKKLQAARLVDSVRTEVSDAALRNMSMETSLSEARNQVNIVRSSELLVHQHSFDELYERQQAVVAALGPNKLVQALEDALSAADHKSDTLKEEVQESTPMDKFLDAYVAARKEYHTLNMKRQAIDHLISGYSANNPVQLG